MCPAPWMVAKVNGPALRVTPAALPSTSQSRSGCAAKALWPVHSRLSVICSFPTCTHNGTSEKAARRGTPARATHPVADPVVLADVDEHVHAALEQRGDVQLRGEELVHRLVEAPPDVVAARREVARERRVDAERLADVGAVEERADLPIYAHGWLARGRSVRRAAYFVTG